LGTWERVSLNRVMAQRSQASATLPRASAPSQVAQVPYSGGPTATTKYDAGSVALAFVM